MYKVGETLKFKQSGFTPYFEGVILAAIPPGALLSLGLARLLYRGNSPQIQKMIQREEKQLRYLIARIDIRRIICFTAEEIIDRMYWDPEISKPCPKALLDEITDLRVRIQQLEQEVRRCYR